MDDNPFRYCGEYYDAVSGTIYLRARYYNADLGRFTQQDGWKFANPEDPLSLNLYTYCWNNPIMFVDPSGNVASNLDLNRNVVANCFSDDSYDKIYYTKEETKKEVSELTGLPEDNIQFGTEGVRIVDSYLIKDEDIMIAVSDIFMHTYGESETGETVLLFEERTSRSLVAEWQVHNAGYYFFYNLDNGLDVSTGNLIGRAKDTDFNYYSEKEDDFVNLFIKLQTFYLYFKWENFG